jgi:hypothetical protein
MYNNDDGKNKNLTLLAYANNFTMWHYDGREKTFETIKSNGYFNKASSMMRAGDLIIVNSKDVNSSLWVSEVKDGTVTLTEKAEK